MRVYAEFDAQEYVFLMIRVVYLRFYSDSCVAGM